MIRNYYQNSSRGGDELPAFRDLSKEAKARFMDGYFSLQVRERRLAQAIIDDRQAMDIVMEAYEAARKEELTRAEQRDFSDRLETRVRELAQAGQRRDDF